MLRGNNQTQGAESANPAPDASAVSTGSLMDPDAPLKNPAAMLGEILLEEGILTGAQVAEGLATRKAEGGFLGQKLIELGYLDQETLTQLLVKQCKIPHINLLDYQVEAGVANLIPEDLSLKYRILPIDQMGRILTVAMVDPLNAEALVAVREAFPDLRIKPILCNWADYEVVFNRTYRAPKEEEPKSEDEDPLFGLVLPEARPKKKTTADIEAEVDAAELAATPAPESAPGPSAEALSQAISASMAQLIPTLLKELRQDAPVQAAPIPVQTEASTGSAVEKKLESLAHSVSQIAQASEVFQAAQRTEERSVAATLREDLDARSSSPPAEPHERDLDADSDVATGKPLCEYRFDTFIPGASNDVTFEVAKAVSASPGAVHNPLYLCGDVGVGKTHLVNAIGNSLLDGSPKLRVGYTSANRFASHVQSSVERRMARAFRAAYGRWDVLILDDIQFLAGHVDAQEELFHVFNALHQAGNQIIIAGDKAPQKLGLLEERLVSRFEGGMVTHLMAPDWATRVAILQTQATAVSAEVPEEVLAMVAMKFPKDVRRMLGSFHKIISCARHKKCAVTCEFTNAILSNSGIDEAA